MVYGEQEADMPVVENMIKDATVEVFSTMVMMDLDQIPSDGTMSLCPDISGMVGLAGDLRGMLAVHCTGNTARSITANMLGMEIETLNEDVRDAIGEIANMIAGGVKSSLAATGKAILLTTPTIVTGKAMRTSNRCSGGRTIVTFRTPEGIMAVELKYVEV